MRTLRVADLEAKPGEKVSGFVHIIGAEFGIPVTLICGQKEGETVLISGGVHNAEYVGIECVTGLAKQLQPEDIKGILIMIHIVNVNGFQARTVSVSAEDGKNLNRVFPGNENGTYTDKLAYFMENKDIALSRERILNHVWDYDYFGDARTIDTHVKKLRSKMGEKCGKYIKTIWGMGYKFEV